MSGVHRVHVLVRAQLEEGRENLWTQVAAVLGLALVRLNVTHERVQLAKRLLTRTVDALVHLQPTFVHICITCRVSDVTHHLVLVFGHVRLELEVVEEGLVAVLTVVLRVDGHPLS